MSNNYYLKINSEKKEISQWQIEKAILNYNSLACDEFLFNSKQEIEINSSVDLFINDERIFSGIIYKTPQIESAKDSIMCYQALGPWQELEEIVYQQSWACLEIDEELVANTSTKMKSHIILGQDENGSLIDIATQIRNILQYSILASANIEIGTLNTPLPMLLDETKDISCAQAIKRILKSIPDTISYFDYSQEIPTINILRRNDLDEKNIDIDSGNVKDFNITPRDDLSISGVEIKYEKTHNYEDNSWNTLEIDKYPEDFNSVSKKALIMTIELDGSKASEEEREVTTELMDLDNPTWWKNKISFLKNVSSLEIKSMTRNYPTLNYELIKGAIPHWASARAELDDIQVKLSYNSGNTSYVDKTVNLKILTTNTESKTFKRCIVDESEEIKPVGLAEALYQALKNINYDAKINLYNAKATDYIAKKINLLNSKDAYSTMQSAVMTLSQDLFNDTLSITAGPPNHLYPTNISEIFRINRNKNNSSSSATSSMSIGTKKADLKLKLNDKHSFENTTSSDELIASMSLGNDEYDDKIILDSTDIPDGEKMKAREVLVCRNGEPAYAYVLMTEAKARPW